MNLTRRRFLGGLAAGASAGAVAAAAPWAWPSGDAIAASAVTTPTAAPVLPERWFDASFGRFVAGDIPRAYPLDAGTTLWVTNDSFLASDSGLARQGGARLSDARLVRNAAFTERAGRLGLIHAPGTEFLPHEGDHLDQWWWFHGGLVVDGELRVIVTRMRRTGPVGWAINSVYDETWLARFSAVDGALLDLAPAPSRSGDPIYGFSVASDADWTYLYGNSGLIGTSATETRVARVPSGRLDLPPAYWNGAAWVSDAAAAAVIHRGGTVAHRLFVFRFGERWLATCKEDEFFGTDLLVLEAPGPTGPWRELVRVPLPTLTGDDRTNTYDVQARPMGDALHVWWSNNAFDYADVRRDASLYRPVQRLLRVPPAV